MTKLFAIILYSIGLAGPAGNLMANQLPEAPASSTPIEMTVFKEIKPITFTAGAGGAVYLTDNAGSVLYAENADTPLPLASLTKLMTVAVAVRQYSPNANLTVPESVKGLPSATIGLKPGEQISVRNLLAAALIPSANDAAETLASGIDKNRFLADMNQAAADLGLKSMRFADPAGLSAESVGSARDVARLLEIVRENPLLRQLMTIEQATVKDATGKMSHPLTSTNLLFSKQPLRGFLGGKTGYTEDAGYNLAATTLEADNRLLYAVVLNAKGSTKQSAAETVSRLVQTVRGG